jgi:predicted DNA-binding protein
MTTGMVRKQIYIKEHQQEKLHKIAEQRGISEAEVIRQAIERETEFQEDYYTEESHTIMDQIIKDALSNPKRPGGPYQFNRQEIYDERESRWIHKETKQ